MILSITHIIFLNAQEKLDINFCSLDELKQLPLSDIQILELNQFLQFEDIRSIYDLIEVNGITINDIHVIRPLVKINLNEILIYMILIFLYWLL